MAFLTPPSYEQTDITDEAKKLLDTQLNQGKKSSQDVVNDTMEGTEKAKEIFNTQDNQAKTLGMVSPDDHLNAIQERANKNYESSNIGMRNKAKLNAADRTLSIGSQAAHSQLMNQNLQNKWYQNELAMRDGKIMARAQFIAGILGPAAKGAGQVAAGNQTKERQPNAYEATPMPTERNQTSEYGNKSRSGNSAGESYSSPTGGSGYRSYNENPNMITGQTVSRGIG